MRRMNAMDHYNKLLSRIDRTRVGCWEWTGPRDKDGYGQMAALGEQRAHRVSYRLHKGVLPKGFFVCHRCDNPACVNPEHLFLGTHTDNVRDMHRKKRAIGNTGKFKTHCKWGHEFAVTGKHGQSCAECGRVRARAKYAEDPQKASQRVLEYYRRTKQLEGRN